MLEATVCPDGRQGEPSISLPIELSAITMTVLREVYMHFLLIGGTFQRSSILVLKKNSNPLPASPTRFITPAMKDVDRNSRKLIGGEVTRSKFSGNAIR